MKNLRIAYEDWSNFSKIERILLRLYIGYLFLIPAVSMIAYEFVLDDIHEDQTHQGIVIGFFLIIIIHIAFIVNNLKVGHSPLHILLLTLRVPIEIVLMTLFFQWDVFYALSIIYAIEVISFCIGLLFGTLFRKADITFKHRLVSIILALFFLGLIFFRFFYVFLLYFEHESENWLQVVIVVVTLLVAAIPYIRIFLSTDEKSGPNMGTGKLTDRLTPLIAIAALVYVIALPLFLYAYFG